MNMRRELKLLLSARKPDKDTKVRDCGINKVFYVLTKVVKA